MITNLFSVFDPSSNLINLSINWLRTFIGLILIPTSIWLIPSRRTVIWNLVINKLHEEFKLLIGKKINKGSTFIFISIFSIILFNNFIGLFPYIFTRTRHIVITLSLALPICHCFALATGSDRTVYPLASSLPSASSQVCADRILP